MNRGFTVVEMLVSLAIFVTMTSVIVTKYGNFNQSTLLTDTAYDIALVVRLAQTYGLSVKSTTQSGTANFNLPYGVDFDTGSASCGTSASSPTALVLFADLSDVNGVYDGLCGSTDVSINNYAIIRGASISALCAGSDSGSCNAVSRLDISFLRPSPEANICGVNNGQTTCSYAYAEATVKSSDNSTRTIVLRKNGQISVNK